MPENQSPIFVTGGTGLLGNWVVRELCNRGHRVRVLCRQSGAVEALEGLDVERVHGDLSDRDILQNAIRGCQAVVHSAAMIHIGWQKLEESRRVNVDSTACITNQCRDEGVKLVYVSTVDTLPAARNIDEPISEGGQEGIAKTRCSYVVSKSEAEQNVRNVMHATELDAVIIHPGFMLAPFDWKPSSGRMFLEVTKAPIAAAPPGGCSVCDARDVAAAIANAVEQSCSSQDYILAGYNLSYQDLWSRMLKTAGIRRKVFPLGAAIKLAAILLDVWFRLVPMREGDVNGAAIRMGCLNHFYSSDRAKLELGYQNRPLEDTLQDAWEFLEKRR
ncbi:MAG: NAD-dependent epimerase/dehydratase family protein [Aureliella sp.]